MGIRFQKRLKLFSGLRLNISKTGLSTSFGTRGAWFTLGHGKSRTTIGAPGTGLSHTTVSSPGRPHVSAIGAILAIAAVIALVVYFKF